VYYLIDDCKQKFLSNIVLLFCIVLSTATFATTLNVYEKPDVSSKIITSMQKTQEHMQKAMQEMFNDFDKNFYTFPAIQPVIVVPENNIKEKTKK